MGVLRAWQARNCVPKPFHYFDLVLLTPLRQPKPGPPPSQPWSSRRAKRPCASAQDVHLRILRARKLKETEIWQRPQGREGHRPFAPWRVENSNSISKLLLPSTIYLVLNLAAHPGAEEGAPVYVGRGAWHRGACLGEVPPASPRRATLAPVFLAGSGQTRHVDWPPWPQSYGYVAG